MHILIVMVLGCIWNFNQYFFVSKDIYELNFVEQVHVKYFKLSQVPEKTIVT